MSVELETKPQGGLPADSRVPVVPPASSHITLMEVWRVLLKKRFVILIVTLLTFAGTTWHVYKTPPTYESVARIQIKPQQVSVSQNGSQAQTQDQTALATAVRILQSDSVMFETAQDINLM